MKFVLCILIRIDDNIQIAQYIDVARFLLDIESFPENQFWGKGKIVP